MCRPTYAYWHLRGIAYPIKQALVYLDVDHVDKAYPLTQAGMEEWGNDKFALGLDFPNLPYWKTKEGTLSESYAILKSVARNYGNGVLMPTSSKDLGQAEMIEGVLRDVWFALIWRCFHDDEHHKSGLETRVPPKMEQLNKFMEGKKWVVGDKISYVDFILYEVLYQFSVYDAKYLTPYSNLSAFKGRFEGLPQIQKFMTSAEYVKGPCFHPMYVKHKI